MRTLSLFILLTTISFSAMHDTFITPSEGFTTGGTTMRILDTKAIALKDDQDTKFTEISDLAYDSRDGKLYAINDKGRLFQLKIVIKDGSIDTLRLISTMDLTDKRGKPYKKKRRDSEGLSLYKGDLLVSFERDPRVILFDTQGRRIKKVRLNKELRDIDDYRDPNDALEAVAYHKKHGVITAPELTLKSHSKKYHRLYSKKHDWKIPAYGSISALEVMPDGDILVLERDIKQSLVTLQKVDIARCKKKKGCDATLLLRMDASDGWRVHNFEGLTYLYDDLYLMISDDGKADAETILVLLEIPSHRPNMF